MAQLSVVDAAGELGVSAERIRALIHAGELPATKIAGRWVVDSGDVEGRRREPRHGGRPLSPRNAWAIFALGDGVRVPWVSRSEIDRLRARLRSQPDLADLAALTRRRGEAHRYRAVPAVIDRLVATAGVQPTGISAEGHNLVGAPQADLYLPADLVDEVVRRYALDDAAREDANVVLRVPSTDRWPVTSVTPRLAVAVDLYDAGDARSRRAAENLYQRIQRDQRYDA
jgi:excisionase family DNA binding protein